MPAYLAYFTRDYDIPPIPATLKATYDDDAVLHDPGDTFADIEPGAEVLFYQPRVGVVGAGIRAKNAVRGWAAFDSYTREPDEGVMYTIQELKDAGVDALPSSRDPNIKIGALIRSTLKGLRRASKADVAAEGAEIERQRALMEVALRPDQPAFAAQVRKNWRDRCPLSGFSGLFCDAAHLVNFASCDPKGAAEGAPPSVVSAMVTAEKTDVHWLTSSESSPGTALCSTRTDAPSWRRRRRSLRRRIGSRRPTERKAVCTNS